MLEKHMISGPHATDMVEFPDSEQAAIAEYLNVVLEESNSSALADKLGTLARARGMTSVAASSGLTREALYKALRAGSQPRFETIRRVCAALGLRLSISARQTRV
ncbi:MAG: putative addiction module antidote protein [Burkholderiaceae bacterium]|jgi:probable addiction module antidote protein|nr:putative addiction module antidote protein [Burkholderiaceae bacterium]